MYKLLRTPYFEMEMILSPRKVIFFSLAVSTARLKTSPELYEQCDRNDKLYRNEQKKVCLPIFYSSTPLE